MGILNLQFRLIKFEFIFAFALGSILFDRFRLGERIGIGEILIALSVYVASIILITNYKKITIDDVLNDTHKFLYYYPLVFLKKLKLFYYLII